MNEYDLNKIFIEKSIKLYNTLPLDDTKIGCAKPIGYCNNCKLKTECGGSDFEITIELLNELQEKYPEYFI